jgi:hypothetical protein
MSVILKYRNEATDFRQLAKDCAEELSRYRRRETTDGSGCLELLRLATVEQVDGAWSMMQQLFGEIVGIWLRGHPACSQALLYDSEENYIAQTFSRFWLTTRERRPEFFTLPTLLSYLHSTLNSLLVDTLRVYTRGKYTSPLDYEFVEELVYPGDEPGGYEELWASIQGLLADDGERRLMYLLYYCGLKPREIVARFPTLFQDVQDIYRQNHNIIQRLRRQQARIRWLLSGEEVMAMPPAV